MLNYGSKAQTVFGVLPNNLAISGVDYRMKDVTVRMIETAVSEANNGESATDLNTVAEALGMRYFTTSLIYLSKSTLRHYFAKHNTSDTVDASMFDGNQKDFYYFVQKVDIPAAQLDVFQVMTVGGQTIKYSDLDYAKSIINGNNAESSKALAKSLYLYNKAAKTFFNTPSVPYSPIVDLSLLTDDYEAQDGETLINALQGDYKITIVAGATITLRDATITSLSTFSSYAGINPLGDATIILEGDNTVKGGIIDYPGVTVPQGSTLTIDGTGSLNAYSNGSGCGIGSASLRGSGNIVINGGSITATGGNSAAGIGSSDTTSCGKITINGGTVTATGGSGGAGIGCGSGAGASCGDITINGGTVTAKGKTDGAGIGSGDGSTCGDITISGGDVTAKGDLCGAGIGSGTKAGCGDITISGGTVEATAAYMGAGIGSGSGNSSCGNIIITNGVTKVTATKGFNAPYSVGQGGDGSTCGTITVGGNVKDPITKSPFIYPTPENIVDLNTTGDYEAQDGDVLTGTLSGNKKITVAADATIKLRDANITSLGGGATYAGITPLGNATIILEENNTVKGGINNGLGDYPGILAPEGYTLTIDGTGSLTASYGGNNRQSGGCGIGGGKEINAGNIEIKGGTITATANFYAAGIGSSSGASCGDITISGGTVTATGGDGATAIGSGYNSASCGKITISGGTVTATGGNYAAGIGSGFSGANCGNITISGGEVTATGGDKAAGIGSSYMSSQCSNITISGGTVNATGGDDGAGIGSGRFSSSCGNITISGGTVNATGRVDAAGIGSGYNSSCGDITITNGVTSVTATKGSSAPYSVGEGKNAGCGTVTIGGADGEISESPYTYVPN